MSPHMIDNQADECDKRVHMTAEFGCPKYDFKAMTKLFASFLILLGICLTACGKWIHSRFMPLIAQLLVFILSIHSLGAYHVYSFEVS